MAGISMWDALLYGAGAILVLIVVVSIVIRGTQPYNDISADKTKRYDRFGNTTSKKSAKPGGEK